ncbi:helix-turn-helix transcriptional regulator [Streptomyces cinereoruber]|uniref:helix-turn-helix transcriptional regulator n=1 Tax=Streptomyces cinereoruber TaxID=67260 RepID=UPI0036326B75
MIYVRDTPAGPGIASRLGVTPGTIRKWRSAGRGPATFRIGGRIVAHIKDIEAYATTGERRSPRRAG